MSSENHTLRFGRPRHTVHHKRRLERSTSVLCLVTRRYHLTTFIMMVKSGSSSTTATSAATAAPPVELAYRLAVHKVGRLHRCEWQRNAQLWLRQVSDDRRVWQQAQDRGRVTEVHKPLAPASELSKYHGACIFEALRKQMPRHCSSCKGEQREYQRLRELHGCHGILPLCLHFRYQAFCRETASRLGSGMAGKGGQRSTHRELVRETRRGMLKRERERREVVDDSDDEFEELEELRRVTVGTCAHRESRQHEEEHIQFTEWCEAACGTGAQPPTSTKEALTGART